MSRDVDVETLRLLVALADTGGIGAAARTREISQPAASARIREFEARWRLNLATRSPRGSVLTEEGRLIVSWARTVLTEVDVMSASMISLAAAGTGSLTVAASLTIAEFLLPRWLGDLRDRHLDLQPQLRVVNSETVVSMVHSGEAALGFIESAVTPRDLEHQVVGHDRLCLVVHPNHPWAHRASPVPTAVLGEAAYVLREPGSGTRRTFEQALRAQPRVALEASSTTALVGAVRAGLGPSVVSRRAVEQELDLGQLVEIDHHLDLRRPLTVVWRRDRRLETAAVDLMRIAARGLPKS